MRILFLTSSAPQGRGDASAPFILTMAQALQALGHEVVILAPQGTSTAHEEVLSGVRIKRFAYAYPKSLQCLTGGAGVLPKLAAAPLKALLLPCFAIGQAAALWQTLRHESFDLLHTHWLLPQGLIGGLLARVSRLPHVCMVHGADVFGLQHPLWLWCKRQAIARTDALIANSSAAATAIHALKADAALDIIPVGATPPEADVIPLAERSGFSQPVILFAGRLFEGKGLSYGLKALAKVPKAQLHIYGEGEDMAEMQALAKALGLRSRVQFMGAVPHAQLLEAMQRAQLFIAPSLQTQSGWREAQGNAIVEAMLCGLPVVASDSGGISDAVINEQTGLLVPEKDEAALASAMQKLLADAPLAQRLANAGRAHALKHFTCAQSAKRIAAVYARLLAS